MGPPLRGWSSKSLNIVYNSKGEEETYQSPLLYSFALGRAAETRPMKATERMDEARILMVVGLKWLRRLELVKK